MTLEKLQKLNPNTLDVAIERYGELRVDFYAAESEPRPVVSLRIDDDGVARVCSSSCLPTTNWLAYAEAYARAASFLSRSGLRDGIEQ